MTQTSSKPSQNSNNNRSTFPQTMQLENGMAQTHASSVHNTGVMDSQLLLPNPPFPARQSSQWRWTSLRTKATALAIALGTIPVLLTGVTGYFFANQGFTEQIKADKIQRVVGIEDKVNRFMQARYGDIQAIASRFFLTDPDSRKNLSLEEKEESLNKLLEFYQVYDLISVTDLKGNVLLQTKGDPIPNQFEREYFQAVLKTNKPFISNPLRPAVSDTRERPAINIAAPIKDRVTGKTIAIARVRLPVTSLDELVKNFGTNQDEYYLIDSSSKEIFLGSDRKKEFKDVLSIFPSLSKLQAPGKPSALVFTDQLDKKEKLFTYTTSQPLKGLPQLDWQFIIATPTDVAFAPQRQLFLLVMLGAGVTAMVVSAIAIIATNRGIRPVLAAATAVNKIGQGDLNTRLDVTGEDEIAELGSNINQMVIQIGNLLQEQEQAADEQRQLKEEQRQLKEQLQQRALELLQEVDPISKGDLTIRAKVTADEIGTIADSYNATVTNLRKIVLQVQQAAGQVAETTSSNEASIQSLSQEALRQAEEITHALERTQEMAQLVRLVAANAEQAELAVRQAAQTVEEGDQAMNRTVDGIVAIRETVAETAKKVKHLGESSQKIYTVVNLINTFAAQTNLLALNASIEAARAGEDGRGFAVVADEVRSLARQSADATREIEKLVAEIQGETNEVVAAMEAGTEQVVMGTKLVEETRQSLNKITATSNEINHLVEAIAQATLMQAQASESVTQAMTNVAAIAEKTSKEASVVSSSFEHLMEVAQTLQTEVGQFKVS
jgi:twitching motility protein PilJ